MSLKNNAAILEQNTTWESCNIVLDTTNVDKPNNLNKTMLDVVKMTVFATSNSFAAPHC